MGIRTIRIHPAMGIARLGNSPEGFFIGPEIPGVVVAPLGGYRDKEQRLKRQAARFRLFAYDDEDRVIAELTSSDVKEIRWTVHLKNTKAAGPWFEGVLHDGRPTRPRRNHDKEPEDLILDPGPRTLAVGETKQLTCPKFLGYSFDPHLRLGTLEVEKTGRLLVRGGHGQSGSPTRSRLSGDFANHDGWFDDVSDGPISAEVTLHDGFKPEVKPAWVVVAPPKFAPEAESIVTLYDTLYQVALDRGLVRPSPHADPNYLPSFTRDIYPILKRAADMRWLFANAHPNHSFDPTKATLNERKHIFRQLRVPSGRHDRPGTGIGSMPFVWSDLYLDYPVNGTLTCFQYENMRRWSEGRCLEDWLGRPPISSNAITAPGLDRAALEPCVGAAFFPGIEVSFHVRDKFGYTEPFRLDHDTVKPGDLTQQMSLPWQTDFNECTYEDPYVWWPAQRPVDVLTNPLNNRVEAWTRQFEGSGQLTAEGMLRNWYRLGFLKGEDGRFVEYDRAVNAQSMNLPGEHFARRSGTTAGRR